MLTPSTTTSAARHWSSVSAHLVVDRVGILAHQRSGWARSPRRRVCSSCPKRNVGVAKQQQLLHVGAHEQLVEEAQKLLLLGLRAASRTRRRWRGAPWCACRPARAPRRAGSRAARRASCRRPRPCSPCPGPRARWRLDPLPAWPRGRCRRREQRPPPPRVSHGGTEARRRSPAGLRASGLRVDASQLPSSGQRSMALMHEAQSRNALPVRCMNTRFEVHRMNLEVLDGCRRARRRSPRSGRARGRHR